jgi:hypothetical protein
MRPGSTKALGGAVVVDHRPRLWVLNANKQATSIGIKNASKFVHLEHEREANM